MTKKYSIQGYVEFILRGRNKNGVISARFSGGTINKDMPMPATLTTDKKVVQELIENSKEYKKGYIKLIYTEKVQNEDAVAEKNSSVSNIQEARVYLMNKHGIPLEKLQTKAAIMTVAKTLAIEFPNLK